MKKRMNAKVFCRNNEYGKMDFYLEMDREFFYLFTTNYFSKNIYEQYYNGKRFAFFSICGMILSNHDLLNQG